MDSGQMAVHAREKDLVLGLDPGRDKTGFAFVNLEGEMIAAGIFPTCERENFFAGIEGEGSALSSWILEGKNEALPTNLGQQLQAIIIGDGTTSREFAGYVSGRVSCEVLTVDERNTTLEARGLYWRLHRPGFLMRLLPEGLRVPGRVLDDFAAWAVALRGLKKYRDMRRNKL